MTRDPASYLHDELEIPDISRFGVDKLKDCLEVSCRPHFHGYMIDEHTSCRRRSVEGMPSSAVLSTKLAHDLSEAYG
jgi:hypothetical protein